MKATIIAKVNPIIEMSSPVLLQCKSGECGVCPKDTGKLLWVPKIWQVGDAPIFNLQYNFFDKAAESTSEIKYNLVESSTAFGNRPDKAYAVANDAVETFLSPSQMKLGNTLQLGIDVYSSSSVGCWVFFRQSNPAIGNVHDALCFEYNHKRRLITFRSF